MKNRTTWYSLLLFGLIILVASSIVACAPAKPGAPVAKFTSRPTEGAAPLEVSFTDHSEGTITTWTWDFGDGEKSREHNPTHVYKAPGTYTVQLMVVSIRGSDTTSVVIKVSAP